MDLNAPGNISDWTALNKWLADLYNKVKSHSKSHKNGKSDALEIDTADMADDAVTYEKLQNVSAVPRVLGRKTAGAGNAEELTANDLKGFLGLNASVVTGSRAVGTAYRNTSAGTMFVAVSAYSDANGGFWAYCDTSNPPTTAVIGCSNIAGSVHILFFVVPYNEYYKVAFTSGTPTLSCWTEWS